MTAAPERLLVGDNPEIRDLEEAVRRNLSARMARHESYQPGEAGEVAEITRPLIQGKSPLPKQITEDLRLLAKFSQTELKPSPLIRSHRKVIGPAIVFVKKLTWPLVYFHLRDTFAGMREFHARLLYALGRQQSELQELRERVRKLEDTGRL